MGSVSQNVQKSHQKKIPDLSHLGPIGPTLGQNQATLLLNVSMVVRLCLQCIRLALIWVKLISSGTVDGDVSCRSQPVLADHYSLHQHYVGGTL